jgi:hypothetical protein
MWWVVFRIKYMDSLRHDLPPWFTDSMHPCKDTVTSQLLAAKERVNKFKVAIQTVLSCTTQLLITTWLLRLVILALHIKQRRELQCQFTVLIYTTVRVYRIAVCTISEVIFKKQSPNCSMSWMTEVQFQPGVQTAYNAHSAFYTKRTGIFPHFPPSLKRSAQEDNHSLPFSAENTNEWSYIFMVWGLMTAPVV